MRFSGRIATVRCFENNPLVRKALEEEGQGRILVVDGGGSHRCALLGDNIAEMAYKNGWSVGGYDLHANYRIWTVSSLVNESFSEISRKASFNTCRELS